MPESPIVLFDGDCLLCLRSVRFIAHRDPRGLFRFARLDSATGRRLLGQFAAELGPVDSVVLVQDGTAVARSTAALRIARQLAWPWSWCAVFLVVPRPIRDAVYDWIARNRRRWFGQPAACDLPGPGLRERILEP